MDTKNLDTKNLDTKNRRILTVNRQFSELLVSLTGFHHRV